MTEPTRSARPRRAARRPGWVLVTALLVLAIGASSALVFTNRVELLKLAVILALWAAVVAAFVSVIYRRQSDVDQAKVRDLKLVYDLQLDREISARREYELSVETQLRRELVTELRAQAADEVAGLRAELAALRANLEILFDADLSDRPALETDRSGFRGYGEWPSRPETAGRVTSSRIDTEDDDREFRTDESPIIDVPEEPHVPDYDWAPPASPGGAHRLPSDVQREGGRRREEERAWPAPPTAPPAAPRPMPPPPQAEPVTRETQLPWLSTQENKPPEPGVPPQEPERAGGPADWQPAPAEGSFIPAGTPGSNWVAPAEPQTGENGATTDYVGRRRAAEPADMQAHSQPADSYSPAQPADSYSPPRLAARRCRRGPQNRLADATPRLRRSSIPGGRSHRRRWPRNRRRPRRTRSQSPRPRRNGRATAAPMMPRPEGSRLPNCSPGCRPPPAGVAVAVAATSEIG